MDIVSVSHVRWDSVSQRPRQILARAAGDHRVFYVEEPRHGDGAPRLEITVDSQGVRVIVPIINAAAESEQRATEAALLQALLDEQQIERFILWYYTPAAVSFTHHLNPSAVVFDCMEEFGDRPGAQAIDLREQLFSTADVIFVTAQSVYETLSKRHRNLHLFPGSVDVPHFETARRIADDPPDQKSIGRPRIGFGGAIDGRVDRDLLRGIATRRPAWQFVLLGGAAGVDPMSFAEGANLHYLGPKKVWELPHYFAGWDVAILPLARNALTRFAGPSQIAEYLAAGKPVVSTSICDASRPYGERGLARIADSVHGFIDAIEAALRQDSAAFLRDADALLLDLSWDRTWAEMWRLVDQAVAGRAARVNPEAARV